MTISLNHTVVAAEDKAESARFLTELFGLPEARPFGPFLNVRLDHGTSLDYADAPTGQPIDAQHYAFLMSDDEFDAIHAKITDRGVPHRANPDGSGAGQILHHLGGRGIYFHDPAGHDLEIITKAYGAG